MFKDVEATLTGGLPCIHEIDPVTGEHSTSEAAPEGAANYVHTGTLTRMSEENDIKIQHQVFDPIDKWISEVDVRPSFTMTICPSCFLTLQDTSHRIIRIILDKLHTEEEEGEAN